MAYKINRKEFLSNKISALIIGLILVLTVFFEFFSSLNQPLHNLGLCIDFYDDYFVVTKVVDSTPAQAAGITKNSIYNSINGVKVSNLIDYRQSVSEETYRNTFSTFFYFDQEINLENFDGSYQSFTLEKLPLLQSFKTTTFFFKMKFCISLVMIFSALVISLFLENDKKIYPFVYSIFFIGLATANMFDSEFSSSFYENLTAVLLDFGIFLTFASIFHYFSQIFSNSKRLNLFKYIRYIPASVLTIKYLSIIIFKLDLVDNPFYKLTSLFVPIFGILIIILFFYVIITFPKNITATFKFFLLGFVFAIIPLLVNHFAFVLNHSIFMTERDKFVSTFAFIFLPFMQILAVLQNKNMIKTQRVAWITTYFAYIILTVPIFITTYDFITTGNLELFTIIYALTIPASVYVIHKIIIKFFSLNTADNAKKLEEFMKLISPITDTYILHETTTKEIVKILNCSYVFYYKKNESGNWDNWYTWGNITSELQEMKLNEAKNKNRVTFYKDGSFSIPIIRDGLPSGVIYIGPKGNGDFYLPGEHLLIVDMIKGFHKHYLMYTNNYLIQELKQKNNKVVQMQESTILSMANLIESRDGGTGAHVKRTAEYSVLIAKGAMEKGLFTDEIDLGFIELLNKAAPMHDIGKIVVPDNILKKPGRFTKDEFELMKLHTTEGERIVRDVLINTEDENYISMTSEIAMHHHEKWNGTGYPKGLKETQIPLCARILAIADVFDALVSPRCYKEPMEPEKAFAIIKEDAGAHFDPVLAEVFLELKDEALEIMKHESL